MTRGGKAFGSLLQFSSRQDGFLHLLQVVHCLLLHGGLVQSRQKVSGLPAWRSFSALLWFAVLQQDFERHLPSATCSRQPNPLQSQRPSVATDAHFLQHRTPFCNWVIFERLRLFTVALWTPLLKFLKCFARQALRANTFHYNIVHNAFRHIFNILFIQEVTPGQTFFASAAGVLLVHQSVALLFFGCIAASLLQFCTFYLPFEHIQKYCGKWCWPLLEESRSKGFSYHQPLGIFCAGLYLFLVWSISHRTLFRCFGFLQRFRQTR